MPPTPASLGDIGECAVAVVVKQAIGNVAVENASRVIGDEQIEVSVAIVIDPGRGKAGSPRRQAGLLRDIGESAVAVVVKQSAVAGVPAQAGHVEIDKAVVVVVARDDRETVDGLIHAGFNGNVGESSIAVVAIQAGSPVRGSNGDVEQTVVVVIENSRAAAAAGLVQSDARGDVLVAQVGGGHARPQVHAESRGNAPGYPPSRCAASQSQYRARSLSGLAVIAATPSSMALSNFPERYQATQESYIASARTEGFLAGDVQFADGIRIAAALDIHSAQFPPRRRVLRSVLQALEVPFDQIFVLESDEGSDIGGRLHEIERGFWKTLGAQDGKENQSPQHGFRHQAARGKRQRKGQSERAGVRGIDITKTAPRGRNGLPGRLQKVAANRGG